MGEKRRDGTRTTPSLHYNYREYFSGLHGVRYQRGFDLVGAITKICFESPDVHSFTDPLAWSLPFSQYSNSLSCKVENILHGTCEQNQVGVISPEGFVENGWSVCQCRQCLVRPSAFHSFPVGRGIQNRTTQLRYLPSESVRYPWWWLCLIYSWTAKNILFSFTTIAC